MGGEDLPVFSDSIASGAKRQRKGSLYQGVDQSCGRQATYMDSKYRLGELLGSGNYGIVRECRDWRTGESFACKIVSKKKHSTDLDCVRAEICLMHQLAGHLGVVQLLEVCEDEENVYLIMELCRGGELFEWLTRVHHFREADAARIFWELLTAVGFCHSRGILHRDLKPENVLLRRPWEGGALPPAARSERLLKICDFGLAVALQRGGTVSGLAGSPYYLAPEVVADMPYGFEADIWSLGIILFILLCGFAPFAGETDEETFAAIAAGRLRFDDPEWAAVPDSAKDLICWLLSPDPHDRPSIREILGHPWLQTFLSADASPPPPVAAAAAAARVPKPFSPPPAVAFDFGWHAAAPAVASSWVAPPIFSTASSQAPSPLERLPSPVTPTFGRPASPGSATCKEEVRFDHGRSQHDATGFWCGEVPDVGPAGCHADAMCQPSRQSSVVTRQLSRRGCSPGGEETACSALQLLDANSWPLVGTRAAGLGGSVAAADEGGCTCCQSWATADVAATDGGRAMGYESCLSSERTLPRPVTLGSSSSSARGGPLQAQPPQDGRQPRRRVARKFKVQRREVASC